MKFAMQVKFGQYAGQLLVVIQLLILVAGRRVRPAEGAVKLVGSSLPHEGTVLVYHGNRWGSVCDKRWEMRDATVVCRQLGFPGALRAVTQSKFGRGRKRIWMTGVKCEGHELKLQHCDFMGWGKTYRNCRKFSRSSGVICKPRKVTTPKAVGLRDISLTDTSSIKYIPNIPNKKTIFANMFRILDETTQKLTQTTQRSTPTTQRSTQTTQRSTQTTQRSTQTTQRSTQTTQRLTQTTRKVTQSTQTSTKIPTTTQHIEETTTLQTLPPPEVEETEKAIVPKFKVKADNKIHSMFKKITNSTKDKSYAKQEGPLQADDPVVKKKPQIEIRMAGGRYPWEGRLEVREGASGTWGAICGDDWTLKETMVACRQMRGDYAKQALQVNYFGGDDLDKIFKQIKCTGRESSLDECAKYHAVDGVRCSKAIMVAGVVCTQKLPDLEPDVKRLEESVLLNDRHLYYLTCSMEENCLSHSAHVIKNTSKSWRSASRRLLKFSTVVHNIGTDDFRPYRAKAQWEWHQCHQHYHSMEVFAHYDLIDEHGNRLVEGAKASFCLEDTTCKDGVVPKFNCVGFRDQGLSVNCSDDYLNDIDCQWIDITDIKPGTYTFKMEINPKMLVAELNFDNNVVVCDCWYSGYNARFSNCRLESLLPDLLEPSR